MSHIDIGKRIIIINSYFANEAKNIAIKNNYSNWQPVGEVIKNPTIIYPINSDNGPEWEIPDYYHVKLDNDPFVKNKSLIVTFLNREDIDILI